MDFFLTPEQIAQLEWHYPSAASIILFIFAIAFFLFLNAFFVANEFASTRVRESQLAEDDDDTKGEAKRRATALHIVRHLDTYLSANQVGITIASLVLGSLGEPFIGSLIAPPLQYFLHLTDPVVHGISFAVAYTSFTFAHVVLGELVPKNLALRRPLGVAMGTALWMQRFATCFSPIVKLFNSTANGIAHVCFGVEPDFVSTPTHSAEEIALIVEQSGKSNEVTETEAEISKNALELNDQSVYDIMVPRKELEVLDIDLPFETLVERITESRHSRFPIVSGHLDNAKGWLHVKDILLMLRSGAKDIRRAIRPLKVVPDTMKLDTLLEFFRREHTHFALVVDEYGDAQGMVYLDDVLEEIVGDDIRDEFESDEGRDFFAIAEGQYIASGQLSLSDLEEELPALGELESEGGAATLGGYITDVLGHLPACDEHLRIRDYLITVTGTDGRRVTQARIEHSPQESKAAPEAAEA